MKYFVNLKADTLGVQSISDAFDVKEGCVQIEVELEHGVNNAPVINQTVKNSSEFKTEVLRALRDKLLLETIWISERHLSQLNVDKSLAVHEYLLWQNYWQELRDLPEAVLPETLNKLLTILPTQPV